MELYDDEGYRILFEKEGHELYILNLTEGKIETIELDMAQGDSLRNVVTDGMTLGVSVMDGSKTGDYETKEIKLIGLEELLDD